MEREPKVQKWSEVEAMARRGAQEAEDNLDPDRQGFGQADTLRELIQMIQKAKVIQGSNREYLGTEIVAMIEDDRIDEIPRNDNLRKTVIRFKRLTEGQLFD